MTFLTEPIQGNYDTPRIIADSWRDATKVCPKHLRVIGIFQGEQEIN